MRISIEQNPKRPDLWFYKEGGQILGTFKIIDERKVFCQSFIQNAGDFFIEEKIDAIKKLISTSLLKDAQK